MVVAKSTEAPICEEVGKINATRLSRQSTSWVS